MMQWQIVSFSAWRGEAYIGLAEVLVRLAGFGLDLDWRCYVQEMAPEPGNERLAEISTETSIDTLDLLALVAPNRQVIDGRFDGYRRPNGGLALRIRAVDSSEWDVESSDAAVVESIAAQFSVVHGPTDT